MQGRPTVVDSNMIQIIRILVAQFLASVVIIHVTKAQAVEARAPQDLDTPQAHEESPDGNGPRRGLQRRGVRGGGAACGFKRRSAVLSLKCELASDRVGQWHAI